MPVRRAMSTGRPAKCTGMMAFVRGVIAASTASRIEVHAFRVDIDDDRRRSGMKHDVHGRAEGHRRRDDLVPGFDASSDQAQVQRGRARVDGYAVSVPPVFGGTPPRSGRPLARCPAKPNACSRPLRRSRPPRSGEHRTRGIGPDSGPERVRQVSRRRPWRDAIPHGTQRNPPRSSGRPSPDGCRLMRGDHSGHPVGRDPVSVRRRGTGSSTARPCPSDRGESQRPVCRR